MTEYNFPLYKNTLSKTDKSKTRNIHFNKDGKYCILSSADRTVSLWNPFKNVLLKVYSGHGHEVLDAISSYDNSQIISGSRDKSLILWDVMSGQALRRFRHHHSQINCVMYNYNDCSVVLSGSSDNTVCIWDMLSRSMKPVQILNQSKDAILSIDVNSSQILTGCVDGSFRIYDLRKGQLIQDSVDSPISYCKFAFDGNSILGNLSNNSAVLLDTISGKILNRFVGHKSQNFKIQCSMAYNDSLIACGSEDGFIYFWDVVSGNIEKKLLTHNGVVYSLTLHPDHANNGVMMTAGNDGVHLWSRVI